MRVCFDIEENELKLLREAVTFAMRNDKRRYKSVDRKAVNWKMKTEYYANRWLALYHLEFHLLKAKGGLENE